MGDPPILILRRSCPLPVQHCGCCLARLGRLSWAGPCAKLPRLSLAMITTQRLNLKHPEIPRRDDCYWLRRQIDGAQSLLPKLGDGGCIGYPSFSVQRRAVRPARWVTMIIPSASRRRSKVNRPCQHTHIFSNFFPDRFPFLQHLAILFHTVTRLQFGIAQNRPLFSSPSFAAQPTSIAPRQCVRVSGRRHSSITAFCIDCNPTVTKRALSPSFPHRIPTPKDRRIDLDIAHHGCEAGNLHCLTIVGAGYQKRVSPSQDELLGLQKQILEITEPSTTRQASHYLRKAKNKQRARSTD